MLEPQKHKLDTIWGHEAARRIVPRLLVQGRLPHALLLTGPPSVGKRSLAFAMAKAILSAGRPSTPATLSAPGPMRASRTVDPDDDSGETDLFGDSIAPEEVEVDLFGEIPPADEPDLFTSLGSDPGPVPAPAPKPIPPPAHQPTELAIRETRGPSRVPRPFQGYDERICRLIDNSYPCQYDKDGRVTNTALMDLTIIEPIGARRSIVVDQIRGLQNFAAGSPVEGAFRVVLIFGADTITQEGANSILKLLEEPPGHLIMILTADQGHRVLPTIRSRSSIIPLAPMDQDGLVRLLLEHEKLDLSLARVAASLSEGRPGAALVVAGSDLLRKRRDIFESRLNVDRFGWCVAAASASRINEASRPGEKGTPRLDEALWLLLSLCRDRMVRALAPDQERLLVHGDLSDLVGLKPRRLADLDAEAERIMSAYGYLQHPFVPNSRVVLEEVLLPE